MLRLSFPLEINQKHYVRNLTAWSPTGSAKVVIVDAVYPDFFVLLNRGK
jgi:hypothetical protein